MTIYVPIENLDMPHKRFGGEMHATVFNPARTRTLSPASGLTRPEIEKGIEWREKPGSFEGAIRIPLRSPSFDF